MTTSPRYRWLLDLALKAFPAAFRSEFGDEMRDAWDRKLSRTPHIIRAAAAMKSAGNLVLQGLGERLAANREDSPRKTRTTRMSFFSNFARELGFAWRLSVRQPLFTLAAVATLAIGVGANTAIFSLVDNVLLRSDPYPEVDQLVRVWTSNPKEGSRRWGVSLPDHRDWQEGTDVFRDIGVFNTNTGNVTTPDLVQRVEVVQTDSDFFRAFNVTPWLGRYFLEEEEAPGARDVAILSYNYWRSAFGSDSGIVGNSIDVDGKALRVVGVMPPWFAYPSGLTAIWRPFTVGVEEAGPRDGRWVASVGRLRAGMSLESAQAELDQLGANLARTYPESNEGMTIFIEPLGGQRREAAMRPLMLLWGAVGLVLLIAAANIANLLLVRASQRDREISIRAAMGATRTRISMQLLVESLPIALMGAVGGGLLAWLGVAGLRRMSTGQIPGIEHAVVDLRVLGYSLGLSLLSAMFFTLIPAMRAARTNLNDSLRDGARGGTSAGTGRVRNGLAIAEIAISVTVAVAAALLGRTFLAATSVEPGIRTENTLTFRMSPGWSSLPERADAAAMYERMREALLGVRGVMEVGAVNALPLGGDQWGSSMEVDGGAANSDATERVLSRVVTPGYFDAVGLQLIEGRLPTEVVEVDHPIAISASLASDLFAGGTALGRRLRYVPEAPWMTIVGVVSDEPTGSLLEPSTPALYQTMERGVWGHFQNWGMTTIIVHDGNGEGLMEQVRERVADAAPGVPIFNVSSLHNLVSESLATERFNATLFTIFAAMAIVLAAVGIYGVLAVSVSARSREMALRVALGSKRSAVAMLVVKDGLKLAALGTLIGVGGALAGTRALDSFLWGIGSLDPISFFSVPLALGAVTVLASALPALRATGADPVEALKAE